MVMAVILSPSYIAAFSFFFFFNDTATTEIYTLSLHDALPIWPSWLKASTWARRMAPPSPREPLCTDRKSTRLNSSHTVISYAVFCLKKKKTTNSYIPSSHHRASISVYDYGPRHTRNSYIRTWT